MEERYIKNLSAFTEAECLLLQKKRVLVAGCGALGGYIIEMLLRLGLGCITAADGDLFEESNLNRQLYSSPKLLGRNKAAAAATRAAQINPNVEFISFEENINARNAPALLCGCDAVLDALDSAEDRIMLARACCEAGVPFIHGAVEGWTAQAGISMPGDGLLERSYPAAPASSSGAPAFTPALCAALQVSLCAGLLSGRPVETGRLYCFDMLNMELETLF